MSDAAVSDAIADLPPGWAWAELGEVADINPRLDPSDYDDATEISFVAMPSVEEESGCLDPTKTRRLRDVSKGYTRFLEGDVLFAKITPCMENGKIALANGLRNGIGFGSTEFHVIRPKPGIEPKYLLHFLIQPSFRAYAQHHMKGTAGQKRVPPDFLRAARIPVAPTPEQRRIVEKIEALLSDIASGVEGLERVERKLATYRQAVLKAAVTGELTRDWRAAHGMPDRRERYASEALTVEPPDAIPSSWIWTTVGRLGEVSGGLTKNRKREQLPNKAPFLRVANVHANELRLDDVHEIGLTEREHDKVRLRLNDLLVVEGNGSIEQLGRVALWDGSIPDCAHQNHLIRVRFSDSRIARYVLIWLLSPGGRQVIERVASSTSGLHTLSIRKVSALAIPLPRLKEIEVILDNVDTRFTIDSDSLSTVVLESHRTGSLRRAILSAAFAGRLLPQDPNDEPASELLARIRRARAASAARRRGRPRKAARYGAMA